VVDTAGVVGADSTRVEVVGGGRHHRGEGRGLRRNVGGQGPDHRKGDGSFDIAFLFLLLTKRETYRTLAPTEACAKETVAT
jgi:hypothetical protein